MKIGLVARCLNTAHVRGMGKYVMELLRNAHVGPLMNSMYVMAMVLLSPRLRFSVRQAQWFYYAAIVMLWGNAIGYSAAVYAPERGLHPWLRDPSR